MVEHGVRVLAFASPVVPKLPKDLMFGNKNALRPPQNLEAGVFAAGTRKANRFDSTEMVLRYMIIMLVLVV